MNSTYVPNCQVRPSTSLITRLVKSSADAVTVRHARRWMRIRTRPVTKGGGQGDVPPANPSALPPLEEEIVQWPCPLIDRVVFYEKLSFLWAVLWASNMPKMLWRPGLHPGPHWENSRSPRLLTQGWTEGGQGAMPPKPWIKKLKLSCCVTHIDALAVAVIRLITIKQL